MTLAPRLYFSFRSPYSWMAVERLRRVLPDLFERIELIPYWDPDPPTRQALKERDAEPPYQQMSKAKHLYVLVDTKRLATRLGLHLAWPVDDDPWWELPHLGWLVAQQAGVGQRCYDALIAARWGAGLDICDDEVFTRVLTDVGLDGAAISTAAHDETTRAAGVSCLAAAHEDDIFGVPYLRLGRQRFWGYDRVEMFLDELRQRRATDPPLVPVGIPVGAYDRDTAGGCG